MILPGTLLNQRYYVIRPLGSGGMGDVFEVRDQSIAGHPIKVLKLLKEDSPDLIKRLQQEADVLQRLPHPGIPKIEPEDGYFCEQVPGFSNPLHYLVMEKVSGETLQEWLKHPDHVLSEREAIAYLKQLVQILDHIHGANFLHRDIKPSNIIRKPDGSLVLIDFGISREMTPTYHDKLQRNLTGTYYLFTRGYAPPEQMDGRAVPQSDFFALGRTLIYAITRTPITELPTAQDSANLQWQSVTSTISPNFARLLDTLTAPLPAQRPKTAQEILRAIAHLERELAPGQRWHELPWAILGSIAIAALCLGVRGCGWLQPLELKAFDGMMQLRPVESPDSRLLLITLDQKDQDWQRDRRMKGLLSGQTLSDEALYLLLQKLQRYQARMIGLDMYRDFPVHKDVPELVQQLQMKRLVTICKSVPGKSNPSIAPPTEAISVGFSDFLRDADATLRRQLLAMPSPPGSPCPDAVFSFSTQIVLQYLSDDQIHSKFDSEKRYMSLGDRHFPFLLSSFGGYAHFVREGEQLLLNYRAVKPIDDIAPSIPLREFLTSNPSIDPSLVQGRIVLIGVTDANSPDRHRTPLGEMPGVVVHAHMISQLLASVYDHRPLLWVWHSSIEKAWIVMWAIAGAVIAWYFRSLRSVGFAISLGILLLTASCLGVFLLSGWIPWVPAVIVLSASGLGGVLSRSVWIDLKPQLLKFLPKPS